MADISHIYVLSANLFISHIYVLSANLFNLVRLKTLSFFQAIIHSPNDKFTDWSKLKAVTGDNLDSVQMISFVVEGAEIIVYQHFLILPFSTMFSQGFCFSESLNLGTVG